MRLICPRQAKIALKASSEQEILELEAIAKSLNLCARSIQDAYVSLFLYRRFVDLKDVRC